MTTIKKERKKREIVYFLCDKNNNNKRPTPKPGKNKRFHWNENIPESSNIGCCQTVAREQWSSCPCAPIFSSKMAPGTKLHLSRARAAAHVTAAHLKALWQHSQIKRLLFCICSVVEWRTSFPKARSHFSQSDRLSQSQCLLLKNTFTRNLQWALHFVYLCLASPCSQNTGSRQQLFPTGWQALFGPHHRILQSFIAAASSSRRIPVCFLPKMPKQNFGRGTECTQPSLPLQPF